MLTSVAGVWTRRIPIGTADGLSALGFALIATGRSGEGAVHVAVNAAVAAYFAYHWWNGRDGGGGPRRRLRDSVRRFAATRRTAPTSG
ncbi:hypothetical protein [Streptomyces sp. NRRL S-146]|uniref:hypothetical protein n=1 Tax=Streptomyces sp. NRRL S-146 TaxID=1463884 RepID=UPI0004C87FED|nr:hypothetical protein [Streptomyces sp. NRRL S-146]